jgi:hypothetical protein
MVASQGHSALMPFAEKDFGLIRFFFRADVLIKRPAGAPVASTGNGCRSYRWVVWGRPIIQTMIGTPGDD